VKYDLVDRRCVVTGASSGIGKEIARNLAYFGATVVLACRDRERGGAALEEIVADSGNDRLSLVIVDLATQSSIRTGARQILAGGAPVHVLVNNAAVLAATRRTTEDGHELTWATNVLGYYLLTNLLLSRLVASAPARVVNVASTDAHGLDLGDVGFERRKYSGAAAYAQSKQADRMIAWALAERVDANELSVHACHPGSAATRLHRELSGLASRVAGIGKRLRGGPAAAALTPTWLAAAPDAHEKPGRFWVGRKPATCRFRARQDHSALWTLCADMTRSDV
jgi:NAD(P)-dependent dehydrogenase (short-subunit alcohol dehydrogenase family)